MDYYVVHIYERFAVFRSYGVCRAGYLCEAVWQFVSTLGVSMLR